jgi:hypothetical protein
MPPKGIHYSRRVAAFHETRSVTDQRKLKTDRPIKGKLPQLVYIADVSVKSCRGILKPDKNLNLPM